MKTKRISWIFLVRLWALVALVGCQVVSSPNTDTASTQVPPPDSESTVAAISGQPRFVFLFIGDGLGLNQVRLAELYRQATTRKTSPMAFRTFPGFTLVTTHSQNSGITDSAAAGTALASGHKTNNGVVGKDAPLRESLSSVSEQMRDAGYKVGIISSVSIDHATPASFYAHADSRSSYYDIGRQLAASGFDFFGGGGFKHPTGAGGEKPDLYALTESAGYEVIRKADAVEALLASGRSSDQKTMAVHPQLLGAAEMPWRIDGNGPDPTLADFVTAAQRHLESDRGFFIMVEGGKIDWACHDNDGATVAAEVIDFDNAVRAALTFYQSHKTDTLILVTADHETGGLSLGNNITPMAIDVSLLQHQRVSMGALQQELSELMAAPDVSFDMVAEQIAALTGLGDADNGLALSAAETARLNQAFQAGVRAQISPGTPASNDEIAAARLESLTPLVIHLLNQKAGLSWSTLHHSAMPVGLWSIGAGHQLFSSLGDNTEIAANIRALLELK